MTYIASFILGFITASTVFWFYLRSRLSIEQQHQQDKLSMLQSAQEQMKHQFADLADNILQEKSKRFTEQNQQSLSQLISPLKEQIKNFEQKVHDSYERESRDRLSLTHEIKHLKELNQKISQDAVNLTNALKGDSKAQGCWGEVILERVLEVSGLQKGREYETQVNLKSDDNKAYQPDVIVHLPDEKDIIIDAKVSLVAYERMQSAATVDERQQHMQMHLQSLRAHIKSLSDKQYQKLNNISTLDFVLMFVPIESALTVAMQADPELFNEALARNIVLVTPTTLLATLRTIQNLWRYEDQNRNALKIAEKAGDLYDKFVNFVEDMQDIGKRIQGTQKSYDAAMNKLTEGRGNLVRRAEEVRLMGAKASKKLCDQMVVEANEDKSA
jgi:DNA recombination protein RmuC